MADFKDRRMAERFPVGAQVSCSFASPVLEDFGPVKIKNVSLTGIGLIAPQVLDPGILLAIKLVNPAKNFSKTVLVRVVHVTPMSEGTFLVGGNLDTPLTYDELCMLVM
jgi:hypothetical protein